MIVSVLFSTALAASPTDEADAKKFVAEAIGVGFSSPYSVCASIRSTEHDVNDCERRGVALSSSTSYYCEWQFPQDGWHMEDYKAIIWVEYTDYCQNLLYPPQKLEVSVHDISVQPAPATPAPVAPAPVAPAPAAPAPTPQSPCERCAAIPK